MRLSILLWGLSVILWISSHTNKRFKKFISKGKVRMLIKTEDGRHARLFVFDWGKFSSSVGPDHEFDVAMVWKDPKTAFSVLITQSPKDVFLAASDGKLRIEGMSAHALWFETATSYIL